MLKNKCHVVLDAGGFIVATHVGSVLNPLEIPEGGLATSLPAEAAEKILAAFNSGKRAKIKGTEVKIVEPSLVASTLPIEINIQELKLAKPIPTIQMDKTVAVGNGKERTAKHDGPEVVLVAEGGGLDSTFILYDLLTNTTDKVHAFVLDMSAVEYADPKAKKDFWKASALAEQIAATRVHEWLSTHIRSYELQTIKLNVSNEARAPAIIRAAAVAAHTLGGCDRFIFGRSPEQMCTARNTAYYKRIWIENAPKGMPMEWPLVTQVKGRPHAIAALPRELQDLTISCHNPSIVDGIPVRDGVCQKCVATDAARLMHDEGVDPSVALDFLMQKTGAGPYVGADTVDRRFRSTRATDEYEFLRSPE